MIHLARLEPAPTDWKPPADAPRPCWWLHVIDDEVGAAVAMLCTEGHVGTIGRHGIAADGTVEPSIVCTSPGCKFHEFGTLDGWTHGVKPRSSAFVGGSG